MKSSPIGIHDKRAHLQELPKEILVSGIFHYFNFVDLMRMMMVCTGFALTTRTGLTGYICCLPKDQLPLMKPEAALTIHLNIDTLFTEYLVDSDCCLQRKIKFEIMQRVKQCLLPAPFLANYIAESLFVDEPLATQPYWNPAFGDLIELLLKHKKFTRMLDLYPDNYTMVVPHSRIHCENSILRHLVLVPKFDLEVIRMMIRQLSLEETPFGILAMAKNFETFANSAPNMTLSIAVLTMRMAAEDNYEEAAKLLKSWVSPHQKVALLKIMSSYGMCEQLTISILADIGLHFSQEKIRTLASIFAHAGYSPAAYLALRGSENVDLFLQYIRQQDFAINEATFPIAVEVALMMELPDEDIMRFLKGQKFKCDGFLVLLACLKKRNITVITSMLETVNSAITGPICLSHHYTIACQLAHGLTPCINLKVDIPLDIAIVVEDHCGVGGGFVPSSKCFARNSPLTIDCLLGLLRHLMETESLTVSQVQGLLEANPFMTPALTSPLLEYCCQDKAGFLSALRIKDDETLMGQDLEHFFNEKRGQSEL